MRYATRGTTKHDVTRSNAPTYHCRGASTPGSHRGRRVGVSRVGAAGLQPIFQAELALLKLGYYANVKNKIQTLLLTTNSHYPVFPSTLSSLHVLNNYKIVVFN